MLLLAIVNVNTSSSPVLGVESLGFYALAFNIANWPWTLLSLSIREVRCRHSHASLTTPQATQENAFSRSLTLASGLAVLSTVLLASLATPLVVGILYGDKWLPAVVALQWSAVFGGLRVILDLCYDLLVAVGRAGTLVRLELVWLMTLAFALPLGAHLARNQGGRGGAGTRRRGLVVPLNVRLLVKSGLRLDRLARSLQQRRAAAAAAAGAAGGSSGTDAGRAPGGHARRGGPLVTLAYCATILATSPARTALRAGPVRHPARAGAGAAPARGPESRGRLNPAIRPGPRRAWRRRRPFPRKRVVLLAAQAETDRSSARRSGQGNCRPEP